MFADPDCQIPVVIGVIPSIPQQNNVLVNTIPESAKIKTPLHPLGIEVPSDRQDGINKNPTEIQTGDLTQQTAAQTLNAANSVATKQDAATAVVGQGSLAPQANGVGLAGARIQQTLGQASPTPQMQIVYAGTRVGDKSKALQAYALAASNKINSTLISGILSGKMTLQDGIASLNKAIDQSKSTLGDEVTSKIFNSSLLSNLKAAKDVFSLDNVSKGFSEAANAISNGDILGGLTTGVEAVGEGIVSVAESVVNVGSDIASAVGKLTDMFESSGSLTDMISNTFDNVKESLSDAAGKASEVMEGLTVDKALSAVETVGEVAWQLAPAPVKAMLGNVANSLAAYGVTWSAVKDGFKGAKGSLSLNFSVNSFTDPIKEKLLSLLATGMKPFVFIDNILEKIEKFASAMEKVLAKAAKVSFLSGISQTTIASSVKSTVHG